MSQLTPEDLAFLAWIHGPQNEAYWVKDENGEKVMWRQGWDTEPENTIKQELAGSKLKKLIDHTTFFYNEENL
jgi:hypothetical protein